MQEIKENMTSGLWRDGITSAPNVREVDEFHEELTAAERRKRTAEKMGSAGKIGPKEKMQLSSRLNEKVIDCVRLLYLIVFHTYLVN